MKRWFRRVEASLGHPAADPQVLTGRRCTRGQLRRCLVVRDREGDVIAHTASATMPATIIEMPTIHLARGGFRVGSKPARSARS